MKLSFCESASETNLVLFTEVLNPIFSSSCWLLLLKRIKAHMQHYLSINNSTLCCLCWCRVMIFNASLGCLVFALSRFRLRAHARTRFNLWIFMLIQTSFIGCSAALKVSRFAEDGGI